jgi:hypothetical protein
MAFYEEVHDVLCNLKMNHETNPTRRACYFCQDVIEWPKAEQHFNVRRSFGWCHMHVVFEGTWEEKIPDLEYYIYSSFVENPSNQCLAHGLH